MKLTVRDTPPRAVWALEQAGLHPLLARLYAARGIVQSAELDDSLAQLPAPEQMRGCTDAARLLADAMQGGLRICIVADYDCDGASACALGLRGLRLLGQALGWNRADYLVPDRVQDGYGLTPSIAARVHASGADVLVTVDNGIASVEGVAHARALGLQVLITDHHLPAVIDSAVVLPQDCVIVNPNQPGCPFPSKALAGVGVMFYVLLALRAELRARGLFTAAQQPRLDPLLPLVALGTVADVVRLDALNRRLVAQGLKRIRNGQMPAGLAALFAVASRRPELASSFDLGFALGPRINAAGRLSDMRLGIECLCCDEPERARELAQTLDSINRERKSLEGEMREQALQLAEALCLERAHSGTPPALCLYDGAFHEGVIGIVAARLKDKLHRPTFVFAPSQAADKAGELKGSGRSIAGFHLRDALDLLAKRRPGVLLRFGGHAAAAGCTIAADQLPTFAAAFEQIGAEWLDAATLQQRLETDGALEPQYRRLDLCDTLQQQVWGQGFAPPLFCEELEVLSQRLLGQKHLALKLRHGGEAVDGIWFGRTETLPARARLAYRLDADEWQGRRRLRFLIEAAEC
ncbi:single-stranded-DNA-specific exonuclease RecJ [Serpentinimonas barnesii]|uniref:single-stranded-DNA-specific exonuclease RecJ n=1 Tax=Serpentinimonas barnesii TaxID=1458427 RepID=UPI00049569B1|nr:single-stranded-DNA-specific exonuclease RecJ [Serpentinimonas barnesii]